MIINTKVKLSQATQPSSNVKQQGGWEDILPGAGGLIGSLFQPEGLVGGAVTSGAGGALGETARQGVRAIEGQGFDPSQILRSAGEQAAYGAIPGGEEMKALPVAGKLAGNILGRTALRAGTGFLGGAAAGAIQGKSLSDASSQGGVTGAINALMPGAGKILDTAISKPARYFGRTAVESAGRTLEKRATPSNDAVQLLFGKGAIGTKEGKPYILPKVQKLIDKYGLQTPQVGGDISKFKPMLDVASKDVESKLQPILKDPIYSATPAEVRTIIKNNSEMFFGTYKEGYKNIPPQVKQILDKKDLNLSDIKDMQRIIGDTVKSWEDPKDAQDMLGRKIYTDLGGIIDKKLGSVDKTEYQDLIQQHQVLSKARESYTKVTKSRGILPVELTSKELAGQKVSGLGAERLKELGIRGIPLLAGAVTPFIPGIPAPIKDIATVLAALYGTSEFFPAVAPEQSQKVGSILQKTPNLDSATVQRVLQQLGVRIPGL